MGKRLFRTGLAVAVVACVLAGGARAKEACGGSERWPVKVASDPEAKEIDASNVLEVSIGDLNAIKPSEHIAGNDEYDRMEVEKRVYRVKGYLALYKMEPDGDYHLAIVDETGRMTRGGSRSKPTGHSFVAEIPNGDCFKGKRGKYPATSRFASEIEAAYAAFEAGVKDINPRAIRPGSIPVTITGVVFFDFDHGQIGRGRAHKDSRGKSLVVELHPVLQIEFGAR